MGDLKSKYSVGDKVFQATTHVVQKRHDCPDCLGAGKWSAKSPAGGHYEFSCPRCSSSYQSDRSLSLSYSQHTGMVTPLTIGSVRGDTASDESVSYMCRETGVGSGSVYYEKVLFPTHEEAARHAEALAAGRNLETPWIVKQYEKTLSVCDYQLQNAIMIAARNDRAYFSSRLQMLFDDLRACEATEQITKILDDFSLRDEAA